MGLVALGFAFGCYSEPSPPSDTEGDGSTAVATGVDDGDGGDDDGGDGSPTATTGATTSPASDGSSGEPPGSTGPSPDGSDTGSDETTSAVVGTGSSSTGELETTDDGSSSDDATTGPVVPPGQCNEMLGVGCGETQFCDYPDDLCGAGQHGVCQPEPMLCNLILQPSCGCNGANYSNPCVATANGTDFAHFGDC